MRSFVSSPLRQAMRLACMPCRAAAGCGAHPPTKRRSDMGRARVDGWQGRGGGFSIRAGLLCVHGAMMRRLRGAVHGSFSRG